MTEMTMRERALRKAADALYDKCGADMRVSFPSDGNLDDMEHARYDGLCAAYDAILSVLAEAACGSFFCGWGTILTKDFPAEVADDMADMKRAFTAAIRKAGERDD